MNRCFFFSSASVVNGRRCNSLRLNWSASGYHLLFPCLSFITSLVE